MTLALFYIKVQAKVIASALFERRSLRKGATVSNPSNRGTISLLNLCIYCGG